MSEVVEATTLVLGKEHPDTLMLRTNLAAFMAETGDLDEAERMHHKVWDAKIRISRKA